MAQKLRKYTVNDGKLLLTLEEAEEGGFIVTSPMDPALITQGETIRECFEMAYDALEGLQAAREKLNKKLQKAG